MSRVNGPIGKPIILTDAARSAQIRQQKAQNLQKSHGAHLAGNAGNPGTINTPKSAGNGGNNLQKHGYRPSHSTHPGTFLKFHA